MHLLVLFTYLTDMDQLQLIFHDITFFKMTIINIFRLRIIQKCLRLLLKVVTKRRQRRHVVLECAGCYRIEEFSHLNEANILNFVLRGMHFHINCL